MASKAGRKRESGEREPNGRLSREGRAASEALAPGYLKIMRDNLHRELQNPLFGSQLGLLNLGGEISIAELEAGKRWGKLASRYQSALGVKGIKPNSFDRVGASCDFDPDSDEGRILAASEKRICDDFEAALEALVNAGRAALFAVRLVCEENQPLSWEQKNHAKCGLKSLCEHWGLTKAPLEVRNRT